MQKDLRRLMQDPNLLPSEKRDFLSRIAAQAATLNMPCYLVGGFVRDLLLQKPVNDFDIVLEGDAVKLGNALVKKFGGKITVHQKFHTCIWRLPEGWSFKPGALDLISARSETYAGPGALPTVKPSTIQDDLRRRDFTINAMAARLDGDQFGWLLDPLDGQADLDQRMIRVLHSRSFIDDPTRIFRAIRYEQRYGFKIEPGTLKLIDSESLDVLSKLSGERIRHEFDLIFEEDNSARMMQRLGELGVFRAFEPDLPFLNEAYARSLSAGPEIGMRIPENRVLLGYLLWLMDSNPEFAASLAGRLDFTSELTEAVLSAIRLKAEWPRLAGSRPSQWTTRLDNAPLMAIYAVWLVTNETALKEFLLKWRRIKPHITGEDLKALGIPPGPRYKEILSRLRAAWLDGEIHSEREERLLLNTLVNSNLIK